MSEPHTKPRGIPVAIVGIGCRFPGGVTDTASFWQLLCEGRDAITEIPPDRIDVRQYFDPRAATPGRMASRWGGFLDRVDEFDAEFFGVSPREAERLDPQQRLLLETAWEALEDAGQDVRKLETERVSLLANGPVVSIPPLADPEVVGFLHDGGERALCQLRAALLRIRTERSEPHH